MRCVAIFSLALVAVSYGEDSGGSPPAPPPEATRLVEQMRGHSMQSAGTMIRSDGSVIPEERRRQKIVDRLRLLGTSSVPPLIGALNDPDVQMRRNAELVLITLAGPYERKPQVDIRAAIPALIKATTDGDDAVRAWAAHALAEIGPDAKPAIPALVALLKDAQEGPRNTSCMALGDIGPAAQVALPELRKALNDPSKDVQRFAQRAIDKIVVE